MEKERLDLLLVYANDLYRYIAKKLGEDYEPKKFNWSFRMVRRT